MREFITEFKLVDNTKYEIDHWKPNATRVIIPVDSRDLVQALAFFTRVTHQREGNLTGTFRLKAIKLNSGDEVLLRQATVSYLEDKELA